MAKARPWALLVRVWSDAASAVWGLLKDRKIDPASVHLQRQWHQDLKDAPTFLRSQQHWQRAEVKWGPECPPEHVCFYRHTAECYSAEKEKRACHLRQHGQARGHFARRSESGTEGQHGMMSLMHGTCEADLQNQRTGWCHGGWGWEAGWPVGGPNMQGSSGCPLGRVVQRGGHS